jgi:hypothetical protein
MSHETEPGTGGTGGPGGPDGPGGPGGRARLRASDAEREQVAQVIRTAMTEGRLSLEAGEERLASVYAATYRDQLTPLVADLPGGGWHALRDTPEAIANMRRHVHGRFGFAFVVAAVLIGIWALSGAHFFWPAIPLAFILLGLLKCAGRHRFAGARGGGWGAAPPWVRH